jgi:hypothetical protein
MLPMQWPVSTVALLSTVRCDTAAPVNVDGTPLSVNLKAGSIQALRAQSA